MPEDLGRFEQLSPVQAEIEIGCIDKVIVDPGHLARPLGARGHGYRYLDAQLTIEQHARERRLAGARGRGQHQHQAASANHLEPALASWEHARPTSLNVLDLLAK